MEIAGIILALLSAILPMLLKWLEAQVKSPEPPKVEEEVYAEMADALESRDADRVAALWAEHDRLQ